MHVLLVEDSPDDAGLILFELNNAAFKVVSERVETGAEMRAAMKDGRWDVVISDFSLPRFGANEALAVLRETEADIPFIIVSGCVGEERAVSLMREGARDFVMKDKLARLVPAIERELREAAMRCEHRQAQERLQENERLLDGVTATLGEGIFVLNSEGRLVFMNPEAERLLGWTACELRGKDMHRFIHSQKQDGPPLPESCCGVLGVLRSGGVCRTEDDAFLRKNGSLMPVSFVASAIMENGKAVASVVAFQDISRRKQAERELLESREQLRELLSYSQTVREEERTRIARELHDELGQMLTGVKLDAMWLTKHLPREQPGMAEKVASMSKLIDETLDAMRRVAADLRPMMLDDLGLAAALEWLVEDFGERTNTNIRLEIDTEQRDGNCRDAGSLGAEVSTAAFRIVQESLTNAARHAQAEEVLISLGCYDGKLLLMVADNGKGMGLAGEKGGNSLGIIGMRERAHSLGGNFHLFSTPGGGTTVLTIIPVKPDDFAGLDE
ncbi:histidine kinase [Candidatus Ferrigenium straubiae]|uniref:PAS domain-containing sensor histidine kinase n=1 Tax=Candidatus Ferrigenium straubiae TaxID=2919506 RepID=UPI003F4A9D2B